MSTTAGDPNNWPRKAAKKHRRLPDAVKELCAAMDEYNREFAITEFCQERIRMAKRVVAYPPKRQS